MALIGINLKKSSWEEEKSAKNVAKNLHQQKDFLKLEKKIRNTLKVIDEEEPIKTEIIKNVTKEKPESNLLLDIKEPLLAAVDNYNNLDEIASDSSCIEEDIDALDSICEDDNIPLIPKRISLPRKPSSFDDEIEFLQDAFKLLSFADFRYQAFQEDLSTFDKAQQDILHKIELCDLDTVSSTKLFKRLKELRRERRAVKNLIAMYSKFLDVTRGYSPIESLKGIAELIDNRSYEIKALHDLF